MKIKFLFNILLLSVPAIILQSCKKEIGYVIDPEKEVFNFIVTEPQRAYINASRGDQYEVTDPLPLLHLAGETYPVDKFEIRGDNTLNFRRKGFSVNMGRKIAFAGLEGQTDRKYEEFKLLAMVYDFTYIENSTAVGLFKEVGLWPVNSFFTEVRLNDNTQGLYYFIEDPFEYFIEQENASFVIRRGYDHVAKAYAVSPGSGGKLQNYLDRFERIYSLINEYTGKELFDSLSVYMDLERYFTKISVDMLLKNGDYTDEIIFYTEVKDNREVFNVFPWDLDDLFEDQPHEIGNPWATGSTFGQRSYYSMGDIIADVGQKLLFSIEDDLDYIIARDSFLYQEYLKSLRAVIVKISPPVIDRIFDYTNEHVGLFYENDSIIAQSKYDVNETNHDLFISNLAQKKEMIKERREMILRELDNLQNR